MDMQTEASCSGRFALFFSDDTDIEAIVDSISEELLIIFAERLFIGRRRDSFSFPPHIDSQIGEDFGIIGSYKTEIHIKSAPGKTKKFSNNIPSNDKKSNYLVIFP
jgi:hypothetical protein